MSLISIKNVGKKFGSRGVLQGISLAVEEGEILVIMGPSGCGKTTLLKIIAGDIKADGGSVDRSAFVDHKKIGFILQQLNVFPWLTAKKQYWFRVREPNKRQTEKDRRNGGSSWTDGV
jgi:ABC-type multidrug transport system ATPase subunit